MQTLGSNLKFFRYSLGIAAVAILMAGLLGGLKTAFIVALLAILEVSLSFDNAIINAGVLKRMSDYWQHMFLTLGIVVAVFGMRILFPIVIVAVTSRLGFVTVVDLALHNGRSYGAHLEAAHPAIAAFGGMFLLLVFLDFMLDQEREIHWLEWLERPLRRAGQLRTLPVIVAILALLGLAASVPASLTSIVLTAGASGLVTYLGISLVSRLFAEDGDGEAKSGVRVTGRAAVSLFLYLEILDAAFSFDGVIGAFAISSDIFVIALGLGIGAIFIRSITVWLVRQDTLSTYVYLEHGAHYAIGALAVILGASIIYRIPDVVTGLIGVAFIGLAFVSSVRRPVNSRR